MVTEVTVLCPDLSNHVVGRSLVLAQIIDEVSGYSAKILGPRVRGREVHTVFKEEYEYESVCGHINPLSVHTIYKLLEELDSEIVYCTKPRLYSFGVGYISKKLDGTKLLLDIDDWDEGGYIESKKNEPYKAPIKNLLDPNGYFTHSFLKTKFGQADEVTTVSTELQSVYNLDSRIIPHARSADRFDPTKYDSEEIKERFGVGGQIVTGFIGSPAPNKGIKESLEAIDKSEYSNNISYVITDSGSNPYIADLDKEYDVDIVRIDPFSFGSLPEVISMFDFLILHQNAQPTSRGQVPAKLTDSLAMGIPTITTNIYGIDKVVGKGALLVDVQDISQISEHINNILEDEAYSKELSNRARYRFTSALSLEAVSVKMREMLESL
jgi:glycosyltransferase involved in cell wall biosynthesis